MYARSVLKAAPNLLLPASTVNPNMVVYLDYNATAPARPEVLERMRPMFIQPLNASSVHRSGREAKKHLEQARASIATIISAWPNEIIFMASGTEANVTALRGVSGRRVLVSAVEHSSVLKQVDSGSQIPVDSNGIVDLEALEKTLAGGMPALVSIMLANNETGVIQPIAQVAEICKKHGAFLHCDAVQGLGKIPVDFGMLGVDMMTLSAHKCGGPLGAAALVVRRELPLTALLTGGGQELGRRAGTENIAAICGFAAAVECAADLAPMQKLEFWRNQMETEIQSSGGVVFGKNAPRLPNTSCVAMPGASGEVQLMDFDLKGFAVSAGSACSSGRIESSHVLTAMGVQKSLSASAIRVSGGWATNQEEIIGFTEVWKSTASRLLKSA